MGHRILENAGKMRFVTFQHLIAIQHINGTTAVLKPPLIGSWNIGSNEHDQEAKLAGTDNLNDPYHPSIPESGQMPRNPPK